MRTTCAKAQADFADELAVLIELEELRRGAAVRGSRRAVRTRVDEHVAFRVDRHAGVFAEVQVGRQLQDVRHRVERDVRHRLLRACACCAEKNDHTESNALHGSLLVIIPR
jgi:hypothetical protein